MDCSVHRVVSAVQCQTKLTSCHAISIIVIDDEGHKSEITLFSDKPLVIQQCAGSTVDASIMAHVAYERAVAPQPQPLGPPLTNPHEQNQ